MCELISPNKKYLEGNTKYIEELFDIGELTKEEYESKVALRKDAESFLANLSKIKNGVDVHIFWLVDNEKFIGTFRLNANLNEKLKESGGNVGYEIRPAEYGKGYGTKILRLGMEKAKELGMKTLHIDCREDNIASKRIIEKNGGVFVETKENDNGPDSLHYRIPL